jgi:hypothetical protein
MVWRVHLLPVYSRRIKILIALQDRRLRQVQRVQCFEACGWCVGEGALAEVEMTVSPPPVVITRNCRITPQIPVKAALVPAAVST